MKSLSRTLCNPVNCSPARLLCPWDSPGKNTGVGCHFLLQGIFPTQGLNPGLPHCRQTLYRPSHPEQVASLCPMTKEADSKPRSPHTALLGRKMGQAGDLFLFWSPVFQRRSVGVLKKTLRLRGEQRPALGVEEEDGTAGPGVGGSCHKMAPLLWYLCF